MGGENSKVSEEPTKERAELHSKSQTPSEDVQAIVPGQSTVPYQEQTLTSEQTAPQHSTTGPTTTKPPGEKETVPSQSQSIEVVSGSVSLETPGSVQPCQTSHGPAGIPRGPSAPVLPKPLVMMTGSNQRIVLSPISAQQAQKSVHDVADIVKIPKNNNPHTLRTSPPTQDSSSSPATVIQDSVPRSAIVDQNSVPRSAIVDQNSVPRPSVVVQDSIPSPAVVDQNTVPCPVIVQDSVPRPPVDHNSLPSLPIILNSSSLCPNVQNSISRPPYVQNNIPRPPVVHQNSLPRPSVGVQDSFPRAASQLPRVDRTNLTSGTIIKYMRGISLFVNNLIQIPLKVLESYFSFYFQWKNIFFMPK